MRLGDEGHVAAILQRDFAVCASIGGFQQAEFGFILQQAGQQTACFHTVQTQEVAAQGADATEFRNIQQQQARLVRQADVLTNRHQFVWRLHGNSGLFLPRVQEAPRQEANHHQRRKGQQHGRDLINACGICRWQ